MAKDKDKNRRSSDPATQEMMDYSVEQDYETAWDRYEAQQPQCDFGELGLCCKNCMLGPCRIDPFGDGPQKGVCGATADTIAARNLTRHAAVGASAHSDHGRDIVHTLLMAAQGDAEGYEIKYEEKLEKIADEFGIEREDKDIDEIAREVAEVAMADFGRQEGELRPAQRAPEAVKERWREQGVMPGGVDKDIVRSLHETHIGVNSDAESLIKTAIRASLGDGWGGSMYATDFTDVLFGGPEPIKAEANLGVINPDAVNVIVHGHEPTLSEMIVAAAQDPDIKEKVKEAGAEDIQLAGICCTANEILMRHGIPLAGNFLQQELALSTGAVDGMVVDVQCIFPTLGELAQCFSTRVMSTSPKAKFNGVEHVEFSEEEGLSAAKKILENAIESFKERNPEEARVPEHQDDLVAGYTVESIFDTLGGTYRPLFRPLNKAIMDGRIRGVAGVVGCNNVKQAHDSGHIEMVKELIRHDVLVVQTGCSAVACGKAGLMKPEAAMEHAGDGLREVCEAVGIAPVLHVGSCVDNSRILLACTEMVKEGGLGDDIASLPVAGAAPEWMSEKAITIALYVASSGIYTLCGESFPVMGSKKVREYLTDGMEEDFGGKLAFERDPVEGAHMMIDHIDGKRKELKLDDMMNEPVERAEKVEAAAAHSS